jgi:catechol 2,3-dioxygenase-like lactoylglutathione lyase family enzyme
LIEHVSFNVTPSQAEACAGFYELLGFVRVKPPAGLGGRSIWLTRGGTSIHLMHRDRDGNDVAQTSPGAGHVAFVVDEYDAVVNALRAAGITIDERTAYWDSPRCYVSDPAGNAVELMASAPSV